ncbi:hypothetical protein BSL78_20123 [Apostichopus japonicus]|uniref:EF-hand domain-containing protein n=1 Tax=Stichopus japonicus TaxID=307972 RepID=A0A2G8K4S7_STIJA|nr:hypothetical protein BSL78_20123 [Apostichopus japonicus]
MSCDELLAPFVALDANGDGYITRKEYRNGSENGSLNKVFERIDTNEDRRISKEEFRFHRTMVANAAVSCDTFAMGRCAEKFSKHLSTQEGRLDVAGSTLSSNGLFCTALQIYVNCIGHEGNVCGELQTYAQRIERTSNAYRNAGICPDLNNTAFSAPNANSGRRHPTNPDRGETRRRSRGSRNVRAAKRRPTLTNGECLWNAFTSCHEDLYQSMSESPRGCTLTKNYRTCVKKSTKRCRDKSNVNKIMSGLKYIRKAHREANMCGLQT